MSYVATDEEAAGLKKLGLDFDGVDVKRGPDRFRMGYHEVHLEGYNSRTLEGLSESLEKNGYRLMKADQFGLMYCSPNGKTRIDLNEEPIARGEMCRITVLKGGRTEGQLPVAEQEVISLFYELE